MKCSSIEYEGLGAFAARGSNFQVMGPLIFRHFFIQAVGPKHSPTPNKVLTRNPKPKTQTAWLLIQDYYDLSLH